MLTRFIWLDGTSEVRDVDACHRAWSVPVLLGAAPRMFGDWSPHPLERVLDNALSALSDTRPSAYEAAQIIRDGLREYREGKRGSVGAAEFRRVEYSVPGRDGRPVVLVQFEQVEEREGAKKEQCR
jgi:hypothetical protein